MAIGTWSFSTRTLLAIGWARSLAAHTSLTAHVAFACAATTGCAEPKPTVPLPAATSSLAPVYVGQLVPGADAVFVAVDGQRLFVADAVGLFVYDVADPASPQLLGGIEDIPVERVAVVGDIAYATDIAGSNRLRVVDVSDPTAPQVVDEFRSPSAIFGGLAAQPGLVYQTPGQIPPSAVYYGDVASAATRCDANDRERGAMDVWLFGDRAVVSIHFDDFAGDGLDGNGAFGFGVFDIAARPNACPRFALTDIVFADEHDTNRSAFERGANSDLQADLAADTGHLYVTGEQRLRSMTIDPRGRVAELGAIELPDVLDVRVAGDVAGLANGEFLLVDIRDPTDLEFGGIVETPGIARAVAPAGDGAHFFVADGEAGVAIVRYGESQ